MLRIFLVTIFISSSAWAQFNDSYESARTAFLREAASVLKGNVRAQLASYEVQAPGADEGSLMTDVLYIPASANPERLIIINSGIHGIEGYVGSAVQIQFLKHRTWAADNETTSYLLIHALNPFGFKNNRRANENNVDLNRNFLVNPDGFQMVNAGYRDVNPLLNPETPAKADAVDRAWFYMRAVKNILTYSMKALRQAVLQGQYEFEKGVYFGGKNYQASKGNFDQIFQRFVPGHKAVFLADLHTGYGQRGKLHLMSDLKDSQQKADLEKVFPQTPIDYSDAKDFYEVHGGLVEYFYHVAETIVEKRVGIVLEYGTLNSQTTLGSLDSVYRMSRENQGFHFGYANTEEGTRVASLFREMFYPSDADWRTQALQDGEARINDAIRNFR